jgi:CRP/FNR family transcriptional regulator, dissimilatory nitrate respiration regulator
MDYEVHDNPVMTILSGCQLFNTVEWHTLKRLAQSAKLIRFDRGQTVFRAGDAEHGLFLIRKGQVKVSILAANGSERVIDLVSQGGIFGDDGLFSSSLNRLNAVLLSAGELVEIPRKAIMECLDDCPGLAASLLRHMSTKLCHLVGELEKCCLRSARQRVIDYLLMLAKEQQPDTASEPSIRLPASKGITASLLDITPETFSRELRRLISMGLIRMEPKSIRILDLTGMQRAVI